MINSSRFYSVLLLLCLMTTTQAQIDLLIPKPNSIAPQSGSFVVSSKTAIKLFKPVDAEYFNLISVHFSKTIQVKMSTSENVTENFITLERVKSTSPNGWYELDITPKSIIIRAGDHEGALNAASTLIQLSCNAKGSTISIPCVKIKDAPRFKWRGMHLDESRHFFGKAFVKKYLDAMYMYHMNTFHWHLTDDQGWRIEIKQYPELTRKGAWRKGSMVGAYNDQKFDTLTYGGFYTQEEIREIVRYAYERGITVVPEIEMPGHAQAAVASYPWLSCKRQPSEVAKGWGVFEYVFCTNDSVFQFLEGVIQEVSQLFPGEYIHIGGDECPKITWKACQRCQNRIKEQHLKDEHELQSYFIKRMELILAQYNKRLIGWDEILEGGLAPNASVMSWRGVSGGIAAARQGHFVVMTPGSHCYFDHYQAQPQDEPLAIGGLTPVDKVYKYEPIPDSLTSEQQQFVLGAQANLWTEYITTASHAEYMVLPRMLALSEVLWTEKEKKSESDFFKRLEFHLLTLEKKGYTVSRSYFQPSSTVTEQDNLPMLTLTKGAFNGKIIYTLDGRTPTNESPVYTQPIPIRKSMTVKFATWDEGVLRGKVISRTFTFSKSTGKNIAFNYPPSKYYNTGGGFTLVNGVKALTPRINSEWLGWSGDTMVATIDLGKSTTIYKVESGFLNEEHNWIYLPAALLIEVSKDGITYRPIASATRQQIQAAGRFVKCEFSETSVRYVRISAYPSGKIALGKPGAGEDSWLFCDEIIIE